MNKLITNINEINELDLTIKTYLPLVEQWNILYKSLKNKEQIAEFEHELSVLLENLDDDRFLCIASSIATNYDFILSDDLSSLLQYIVDRLKNLKTYKNKNGLWPNISTEFENIELSKLN